MRHIDYDQMSIPSTSTSNANFISMNHDLNDNQEDYHQYQLDVELALFLSAANIKNVTNNYFFRQFLSNLRPDFKIPQLGFDVDKLLNQVHLEIVSKMKQILRSVDEFTLLANVVSLELDESEVLCISIGFKYESKFQVMLLSVYEFNDVIDRENPSCNILSYIAKTLGKFHLNPSQVVCTIVSGFEDIGVKLTDVVVNKPFYCQIEQQISKLMSDLFDCSKIANEVRFIIMSTIQDFYKSIMACSEFEKRLGHKLDNEDYEEAVQMLLTQREIFIKLCEEYSIKQIKQDEWTLIDRFFQAKGFLQNAIKIFMNDTYFTIDLVVPQLRILLNNLTQISLLDTNFVYFSKSISDQFDYILNPNNPEFNPIFTLATFLNPEHYGDLDRNMLGYTVRLMESLIIKYVSNPTDIVDLIDKLISTKFDEELSNKNNGDLAIEVKKQISDYQNFLTDNFMEIFEMSAYKFWQINGEKFDKIALIANELLCITFTATPPFDSLSDFSNSPNNEDAIQRGYSTKNPVDYFRWTQNKVDLCRNALIRLNWNFMDYDSNENNVVNNASLDSNVMDSNSNIMEDHQQIVENGLNHQFDLPMPPQPPQLYPQENLMVSPDFTQPIVSNPALPGSWCNQHNQRALSPIRILTEQNEEENISDEEEEDDDPYGLNGNQIPLAYQRSSSSKSRSTSRSNSRSTGSQSPYQRRNRSRSRSRSLLNRRRRSDSRSSMPRDSRRRSRSPRRRSSFSKHSPNSIPRPVLMVYNIDWKRFNCKRMFNLFSAYGHVKKINFLRQDRKTCMIQMKNEEQAKVVHKCLDLLPIFDVKLEIIPGKCESIRHDPKEGVIMSDGSKSCCEYSIKKVQHLPKPPKPKDAAYPCDSLYFNNLPSNYNEQKLRQVLKDCKGPEPRVVLIHPPDNLTGVMTFETVSDAAEALMFYNNMKIGHKYLEVRFYREKDA